MTTQYKVFDFADLERRANGGRETNLTRAEVDAMRAEAVFVCLDEEEDENGGAVDYFVVKIEKGYAAIIGATLLEGADQFEISGAIAYESRDGAIAEVLAWSAADAGGRESFSIRSREVAVRACAWT